MFVKASEGKAKGEEGKRSCQRRHTDNTMPPSTLIITNINSYYDHNPGQVRDDLGGYSHYTPNWRNWRLKGGINVPVSTPTRWRKTETVTAHSWLGCAGAATLKHLGSRGDLAKPGRVGRTLNEELGDWSSQSGGGALDLLSSGKNEGTTLNSS